MSSPVAIRQQFSVARGRMTSLDRCNKCGAPRTVHGPDWTCPAPPTRKAALVMLCGGAVLMIAGLLIRFISAAPLSGARPFLFFACFYLGLYVIFAGAITIGRRQ